MTSFVLPDRVWTVRLLYWMAEAALSSLRLGSVGFLTTVRRTLAFALVVLQDSAGGHKAGILLRSA